jgi:lipid-A-disaccharide synthase-like uncharacterized protein
MTLLSIFGWIGASMFVIAYLLLSLEILSSKKTGYHVLNLLGGLILSLYSYLNNDMPNFAVNLIWMLIAVYSTVRIIRIRLRTENNSPSV